LYLVLVSSSNLDYSRRVAQLALGRCSSLDAPNTLTKLLILRETLITKAGKTLVIVCQVPPKLCMFTLSDGCVVQPGLFTRIKVSHENVGVQPAFCPILWYSVFAGRVTAGAGPGLGRWIRFDLNNPKKIIRIMTNF
jgi:hypothetical protein